MEELIFSLITCFLHRRFFPKGEVLRRASRHYRRMPGKPGTVCARSDQDSVNDGTVPAVSVLRQQTPCAFSCFSRDAVSGTGGGDVPGCPDRRYARCACTVPSGSGSRAAQGRESLSRRAGASTAAAAGRAPFSCAVSGAW